ncbi:MAG: hypothetical protein JNM39_15700 [Bdellovibrionaceae bacterium]|nr:hypothetical protein [Pseudobdellovibrionaceae bacterium]
MALNLTAKIFFFSLAFSLKAAAVCTVQMVGPQGQPGQIFQYHDCQKAQVACEIALMNPDASPPGSRCVIIDPGQPNPPPPQPPRPPQPPPPYNPPPPPPPYNPPGYQDSCERHAARNYFSRSEAERLCLGARSEMPAYCAVEALDRSLSRTEAIRLCRLAETLEPVECQQEAYQDVFGWAESIQLCSNNGSLWNSACAIDYYRRSYSTSQAVAQCRNR